MCDSLCVGDQVLVFELAGEVFAVDVTSVREIQPAVAVTPIPDLPPYCEGVFNLRGVVVPAFNLRERCGLPPKDISLSDNLIIVDHQGALGAFRVDSAREVVTVSEVLSQADRIADSFTCAVRGAFRIDDALVPVIELVELLGDSEKQFLRNCQQGLEI